jgi:FkbM family methyltransferase
MYSQNNEEQVIKDYFKDFKGVFLDIGSNDGITLSNTRALAEQGWSGVCVEPSPTAFVKLQELYKGNKNVYCYPFALGTTNDKVILKDSGSHLGKSDSGLLSTLIPEETNRWKSTTQYTDVEVQCYRYKTFLNRIKFKKFDFVSIDVEGMEVEIMKQMDFTDVKLVCAEWNSKPEVKSEFDRILYGFNVIYTSAENLIYAK